MGMKNNNNTKAALTTKRLLNLILTEKITTNYVFAMAQKISVSGLFKKYICLDILAYEKAVRVS